ncbi:hypothetical protein KKC13_05275 [bacterium]|nr:hypothetical protein [bacterium]MBU1959369.1 hypothetical protein [bacterium]
MDLKTRKKYYNRCNPYTIPSWETTEIIDIDGYAIEGRKVKVRGKKWAEHIAKKIMMCESEEIIYFTGYPGSGKTTELQRVEQMLGDSEYANLLPVYINALEFLPIHASLDQIDILSTIVYNVIEKVSQYQGKEKVFGKENYFERLWKWLTETEVTFKGGELGDDHSKLVFEMKDNPSFRTKIKYLIQNDPSKFKQDIDRELYRLNELVKTQKVDGKTKEGIVVIFDSLEHNRGIGAEAKTVADDIQRLFSDRDNLAIPVHVIYTVPPYLHVGRVKDIEFLPVVRVIKRDNGVCQDGIEVMKSLVYKRIPKEDLKQILGDDEKILEEIIQYSGGYPRDLLRLLREAILVDNYPLSRIDIDGIFQELENEYRDTIAVEDRERLTEIYHSKDINFSHFDHIDVAERLFSMHVVLRYRNGEQWFTLNPPSKRVLGITDD